MNITLQSTLFPARNAGIGRCDMAVRRSNHHAQQEPQMGLFMFFGDWSDLGRVIVVGALAYAALVVFLRISGKRTLTKLNAFDLVITVALGSTLSAVLLNKSVSLAEGVTAFALLILLQFGLTWLSVRSRAVEKIIKSEPTLLLRHGEYLDRALQKQRITRDEVMSAIRSSGNIEVGEISAVILETDGSISVVSEPSTRPTALAEVNLASN